MEKRQFKGGGENVSLLGFGAMRLPNHGKVADIDVERSTEMVKYAYDNGVNYFDTAYPYHDGQSELFLGEALKVFPRESFYLATKMPFWQVKSDADPERLFNEQLKKLQVEYFDFYLAHNLDSQLNPVCEKYHAYDVMARLKKEGRIRRLGFSFHDKPELLEKILADHDWDFVQLQINYLDWELQDAKRQYEIAMKAGKPVIVMEPVRGGSLARLIPAAVDILKSADADASPASWAMRYVGSLDNVLTVLSGMSTLDQVKDNVKTFGDFRPLSKAERETLDRALTAYRTAGAIPCTNCRYCMPCPVGVDIPNMFMIYNDYKVKQEEFYINMEYNMYDEKARAGNCVSCNQCVPKCPQHIAIPDMLKEVATHATKYGTA